MACFGQLPVGVCILPELAFGTRECVLHAGKVANWIFENAFKSQGIIDDDKRERTIGVDVFVVLGAPEVGIDGVKMAF
ncbi:MAG: hypothetical protein OXO49_04410 [Gammaproteobacteria bacterium]|nr:hypothetical protein [Gammaproteobacteria bacterium]MDE0252228.1 hypothetical protein [Gammaproteobacteria bacterium]MDE0402663.1 hypothetical protein [Gammaproteobacteria bacterium]